MADHVQREPEAQVSQIDPTLQRRTHEDRTLVLISVPLVRAGQSAWHEPAVHAAERREQSPTALFQRGFVSVDGRLRVALGALDRLDQSRATAARVKGAAQQPGAWRDRNGAPLSRQAS